MHKKTKIFLKVILLILLPTINIYSQNLLNNGDFESGGSGNGFNVNGVGYTLITAPFTGVTAPGNYAFTTNPQPMNTANFIAGGDHTSGTGNMMIIDGNSTGGQQRFWRAGNIGGGICSLTVGATYTFTYWIKSVSTTVTNNATRADISIQFNNTSGGTLISGSNLAPLPASGWQQVVYTFVPTNACVNIEMWNNNTSLVGNDFAVDDFSLIGPPMPLALTHSFASPSCPGQTDGTLVGYATGGSQPYTYTLTGTSGGTNATGIFTGLVPGTYSVSVTDALGTSITRSAIILIDSSDLTVSPAVTICSGASTTLSVSGGNGSYTWTASPPDSSLTTPNSANPTVSPTTTTTYTVNSNSSTPTNVIYNGDFSLGNTGFVSDYNYYAVNTTLAQRAYGVVANANTWESAFSPCVDHTSGTGNMLVVDGSATNAGNDRVWCQTVAVTPGMTYTLTYWLQSVAMSNPASIQLVVNGVPVSSPATAPLAVCSWGPRNITWNSGANTTAEFCFYDRNTATAGNDFAIDDISLRGTIICSLQKSVTVTVVSNVVLTITNPTAVCTPSTVNLTLPAVTAGSTTGTTLTYWTNNSATFPLLNPSAVAVSGTYYIKSTAGTCSVIQPVVVTISAGGSVAAPVVTTPLYYCQGSVAPALTATALPGATLNWYGTNATGGIPSPIAPVPSTATVGTTNYYVSQTVGLCESPRVAIRVIISSTMGVYNLFCDPSQITTVPPSSVYFDWTNLPGPPVYSYTYSINGGPPVTGSTNISSFQVFGVTSGQSVTFTIVSAVGYPCVQSETETCSLCTTTTTPMFATIPAAICSGSTAPLLPGTSDNGISGTWSPTTVSNTTGGSYVFTPDPILFPCATGPITKNIAVSTPPNAGTLSGTQNICVGLTSAFTSTTTGGTWSSNTPAIAAVNATTGVVTGVSSGTATISYTVVATGGCTVNAVQTRPVTVTAPPTTGTLSGTQNICIGSTTTFSSTVSGGTWSSASPAVASVNPSTGVVTGLTAGTSNIIYTVSGTGGCAAVASPARTVTVTAAPNAGTLGGNQNICVGLTTTFTSTATGGIWSSLNPAIATVNSATGVVSGVSAGTTTVNYTVLATGGCSINAIQTRTVTVTAPPTPGTVNGTQNVCVGLTTTFSSTVSGGTWSSSNAAIATINAASGVVTGVSAGTSNIIYTVSGTGGCASVASTPRAVTVTAAPNAGSLSGNQNICIGLTTTFSSTATGGSWSSLNPAIATVNSTTGVVTGVSVGTATINYTVLATGGCIVNATQTRTVTVTAPPTSGTISGTQNVCVGSTTTFTSTVSGGAWSSASPAVATINATTGVITGVTAGTSNIIYTVAGTGGCASVSSTPRTVTVNANIIPTFAPVNPICSGSALAPLPLTSQNGITGTWSPSLNNTVNTLYTFTPTPGLCATTASMTITVIQKVTPVFDPIAVQCHNDPVVPVLPLVSQNGINGTWSPAAVSLATIGTQTYTFIPNSGECVTATTVTLAITVVGITIPNFTNRNLCSGKTPPTLDPISPNGVEGTWTPSVVNNMVTGSYLFTPNTVINQCATPQTITVTIIPRTIPTFAAIAPFCVGATAPLLDTVSQNGINGTWSPTVIENTLVGTNPYVFTPASSECATTIIVEVTVTPPLNPDFPNIFICKDTTPPVLGPVSPNGLSGTWSPAAIDSSLLGTNPYVFTPNAGECGVPQNLDVTVNEYTLNQIEGIVSNYFDDLQVVTVIATGPGSYWYQLDNGPLQENNVFQNVAAGLHTITVYDQNNCGPSISDPNIMVINYPKFFTPNGDGFNDLWNIYGLSNQGNSRIFIFDRYGKLIKEISPGGLGWDGTYNGSQLPATDYWFTIDYMENTVPKQFKAHFSLKR